MVEAKTSFTYHDVAVLGNVAWPVARIFHQLSTGVYLNCARTTSKLYIATLYSFMLLNHFSCFSLIVAKFPVMCACWM